MVVYDLTFTCESHTAQAMFSAKGRKVTLSPKLEVLKYSLMGLVFVNMWTQVQPFSTTSHAPLTVCTPLTPRRLST